MRNNVCYKLCENGDLYYLIKSPVILEEENGLLSLFTRSESDRQILKTDEKSNAEAEIISNTSLNEFNIDQMMENASFDQQNDDLSSINTSQSEKNNQENEKIKFYQESESSITSSIDEAKNCKIRLLVLHYFYYLI